MPSQSSLGVLHRVLTTTFVALCCTGCITYPGQPNCEVPVDAINKLHSRAYEFMESKGYSTKCEELFGIHYVKDWGCGIYGNATHGDTNPRTGAYCPMYLDGGYYVIFDPQTLNPEEVVLIAW